MLEKLKDIERKFTEIEKSLADPKVISNHIELQKNAKVYSELAPIVSASNEFKKILKGIDDAQSLLESEDDEEFLELAREELKELNEQKDTLEKQLIILLIPKDPNDEKSVVIEVRAAAGGEEASLFARDLFRLYTRYAEDRAWKTEIVDSHVSNLGGFDKVVFLIEGDGVYSRLKYEGGVHRVQRVPVTEASGRKHTSTATVAVLPEAEDIELEIDESDLRIDTYRSSGPGGQSVNTTDSAVRITYIPTGMIVTCQDEKSQHKNRAKAMKILQTRLRDQMMKEQNAERAEERRGMVGKGLRSQKIRTYNFYERRVTDHRINLTLYKLDAIMDGAIDPIIDELILVDQAEMLKELE